MDAKGVTTTMFVKCTADRAQGRSYSAIDSGWCGWGLI